VGVLGREIVTGGDSTRLGALAALAFMVGALSLSCGRSLTSSETGDIRLAVVLPVGGTIQKVTYQVVNSGNTTIAGPASFEVLDPNATVALDIEAPLTQIGNPGDFIQLSATDGSGESCTGTSASFPVLAGNNAPVLMTLVCGNSPHPGSGPGVTANVVEGDHCPEITSGMTSADDAPVDSTVLVAITASDADPHDTLTYAWAPSGNFANRAAPSTLYACTASGIQHFTMTVTDSHDPPCTTTAAFTITCDPAACGDDILQLGEQCDPPDGVTCDASCQLIP